MSDELDESNEQASAEELEEIDDILSQADPDFINELKSIRADNLNNQDIGLPTQDEVIKKDRWYYRFWFGLDRTKQMLVVLGGFILFVALPLLMLSTFGLLTPSFLVADQSSLEPWADEKIALDAKKPSRNLMDLFLSDQFFLEIPEQVYVIKPLAGIKVARFAFYLEIFDREHASYFEPRGDEIAEILSRTLKMHTFEEFKGMEGKEEMRKELLAALNSKLKVKVKNVRYKLLVF
jgi:flagellar basal body-associated protein FliL